MIRQKKTKKRPTRRYRFFKFLFFLILLVAFGMYIASLPIFRISDIVVNGAKMLSAEEIKTLAGIPLSENLFFADFSRARVNLAKIPGVKNFKIYRIPPGTILISLTERKPIATIVFPKRSAVIDEEGYILNRRDNIRLNIPNITDLPVISGINEAVVVKGEQIDGKTSQLMADIILKLSRFLETRSIQLELGGLENISFLLDDLLQVKLGSASDIKRKMEVFEALLPAIAGKWTRVQYIDVRFPNNPVIKFK